MIDKYAFEKRGQHLAQVVRLVGVWVLEALPELIKVVAQKVASLDELGDPIAAPWHVGMGGRGCKGKSNTLQNPEWK